MKKVKMYFENPAYNYTVETTNAKDFYESFIGTNVYFSKDKTEQKCIKVEYFESGDMRAIQLTHEQIETLLESLKISEAQLTELHIKASGHLYPSQQGAKSPLWAKACRFSDLASSIKGGELDV